MRVREQLTVIVVLGALAAGCAAASTPKAFTPPVALVSRQHEGSVSVRVSGGQEYGAAGQIGIRDEDLRVAVLQALRDFRVFSAVDDGDRGDYQLHVHILKLDQPLMGASMTVTMDTAWRVTRNGSDEALFESGVTASHTAAWADAFLGSVRLRLANEGAARENIRIGIERLARAKLD